MSRMKRSLLLGLLLMAAPAFSQTAPTAPPGEARQLFLFLFSPGPNWRPGVPMRQQDLRAHGAYHAALVREGRSVAGGGYVGLDGGLAIVRAASLQEAEAILAADPAIVNGVFSAELRQWSPRFYSDEPLVEGAR